MRPPRGAPACRRSRRSRRRRTCGPGATLRRARNQRPCDRGRSRNPRWPLGKQRPGEAREADLKPWVVQERPPPRARPGPSPARESPAREPPAREPPAREPRTACGQPAPAPGHTQTARAARAPCRRSTRESALARFNSMTSWPRRRHRVHARRRRPSDSAGALRWPSRVNLRHALPLRLVARGDPPGGLRVATLAEDP